MALDINNYENALQQGALIQLKNMATGSVGTATLLTNSVGSTALLAQSVQGSKLTTSKNYAVIAVNVNSATNRSVNVFGTSTVPVAGTVTGMFTSGNDTSASNVALWGTTAGTIAWVTGTASYVGFMTGTTVLNAAVVAGDALKLTPVAAGSVTAYITFETPL